MGILMLKKKENRRYHLSGFIVVSHFILQVFEESRGDAWADCLVLCVY